MSQLSLKKIKLGDSADTAKNFLISVPTIPDGTLTIERENGTDVLTVDAAGKVAFPGNVVPAFIATKTNTVSVPGNLSVAIVTGFDEQYDLTSAFDASTGKFQPNVAGFYQVSVAGQFGASLRTSGVLIVHVCKGASNIVMLSEAVGASGSFPTLSTSGLVYLNGTTDYLTCGLAQNSGSTWTDVGVQHFSASLVRAA